MFMWRNRGKVDSRFLVGNNVSKRTVEGQLKNY